MQARILDRSEEARWDEFAATQPFASIHQCSDWGHFQAKVPSRGKYWIIVIEKDSQIIAGTLLIRHKIKGKYTWLYAPRGPLLNKEINPESQLNELLKVISPIAEQENAIFLRIDPYYHHGKAPIHGFKFTKHGFQPQHTIILDISQPEEEILQQMKPKGRYNIRLAEKKGVKIHKSKDINAFFKLLEETTERDAFHGHGVNYYNEMLQALGEDKAALYLAEYDNEVVAGIIVTYFNETATYYYGASGNKHRNVMAPYLIHWEAIKDAKALNYKKYDLFGIAPENVENHPWKGVTEFKKKFGGEEHEYSPAQEKPFKKLLYFLYGIYKKLR